MKKLSFEKKVYLTQDQEEEKRFKPRPQVRKCLGCKD